MDNIFFNAHHSPVGAFSSFTLGFPGAKGGLGIELGKPADQNVYIGAESIQEGVYEVLPFFEGFEDDRARYEVGIGSEKPTGGVLQSYEHKSIQREFNLGTDRWRCGDIDFCIYTPVLSVPDPEDCDEEELKRAIVPAVIAELTLDNRKSDRARRMYFGFQGSSQHHGVRVIDASGEAKYKGVAQGRNLAVATCDSSAVGGLHFTMDGILNVKDADNLAFGLGTVAAVISEVAAGEKKTMRFAICFCREGIVTAGLDTSYLYSRFFKNIEEVAAYALESFDFYKNAALQADKFLDSQPLSDEQKFMFAHSVRSYYGSTQLLDCDGKALWVVNEGEYRMMNTLDLTVDQLYYEMTLNPWMVRNELDTFLARYSYRDKVRFPGDDTEHPGGLSFTHDMGIANVFWRKGHSCYEQHGIHGCFSHMTQEQLVNWICCGVVYWQGVKDDAWKDKNMQAFKDCLASMINRDNPDPSKRNGIMSLDSSRTKGGSEITTYDSLDASLGQARNSAYLAMKCLAAYLLLEELFDKSGESKQSQAARAQAELCAKTLLSQFESNGTLPAVLFEDVDSLTIPVVEGLALISFAGLEEKLEHGVFAELVEKLRGHIERVLKVGVCLFEGNGWKLSSTSDNSWLCKIYISQYVARKLLGIKLDGSEDQAHVRWLLHPEKSYWAWSDQIVKGEIEASKYYPRGVTSVLWLYEIAADLSPLQSLE